MFFPTNIVNVGQTPEEKKALLAAVGVTGSTAAHCIGEMGRESFPVVQTPDPKQVVVVSKPAGTDAPYGQKTPINTLNRPRP